MVVSSRAVRSVAAEVAKHIAPGAPVAVCTKGIEPGTGLLVTQVAEQELGAHPLGTVSGPTFVREAALGHPTAASVAFPFTRLDRLAPHDSTAAREASRGASVWAHDYNLRLVPAHLRQFRPDLTISFFHHRPFPAADMFNVLPLRKDIVERLLAADVAWITPLPDGMNLVCK